MGIPMTLMAIIICIAFAAPAYFLGEFSSNPLQFSIYVLVVYLGVIAHLNIQYLCASFTPNPMIHTLVFPGILIPFEVRAYSCNFFFSACDRLSFVGMSSASVKCTLGTFGWLK